LSVAGGRDRARATTPRGDSRKMPRNKKREERFLTTETPFGMTKYFRATC